MNIQSVFSELESASDFELFRLQQAILKVLDDPDRMQRLKRKIQVGMTVDYFCAQRNTLVAFIDPRDNQEYIGQVVKLNPKRVVLGIDNKQFSVPYSLLFPVFVSQVQDTKQTLLLK